jgi:hypothetical protein
MALSEKAHAGSFILSEANRYRSRENIVVNSGQGVVEPGTVLGRILAAAAAVAGTNTGNGTVTVGAAIGIRTQIGIYKLVCVAIAANAGTFNLYGPDGSLIRQITVGGGATVSDHLTITIADGATDFAAGDSFTIEVTGGDYEALDTAATTGEQAAAAVLLDRVDATSADVKAVGLVRSCELNSNELTWPAGISAANKAIATARLAESGVLLR